MFLGPLPEDPEAKHSSSGLVPSIQVGQELLPERKKRTVPFPFMQPSPARGRAAVPARQLAPKRAGSQDPGHALEARAVVRSRPPPPPGRVSVREDAVESALTPIGESIPNLLHPKAIDPVPTPPVSVLQGVLGMGFEILTYVITPSRGRTPQRPATRLGLTRSPRRLTMHAFSSSSSSVEKAKDGRWLESSRIAGNHRPRGGPTARGSRTEQNVVSGSE